MSTYTESLGLELITPGSQAGLWGNTTNNSFNLIDQAITGVTPISFASASGATKVLTDDNGAENEARAAVLNITGTASGANTIVVPNKQKTYLVRNATGQTVTFQTATPSATYPVEASNSILIFCDGNNNVFTGIASPSVGTLTVSRGGTGATTFTAGFVKSPGGTTDLTSSATVALGSEVSGTLPVTNGGTGQTSLTSGALLFGSGTGAVGTFVGSTNNHAAVWNGSAWASQAVVNSLTAGSGVTLSGTTGNITISASGSTSGVSSISAGTGISVNQSTGAVTITNTGPSLSSNNTWSGTNTFSNGVAFTGTSTGIARNAWNLFNSTYNTGAYNSIFLNSGGTLATQSIVFAYNNGGSAAQQYIFAGNGTASAANWNSTSDIRIKENVVTLNGGLDKLIQLRPVEFSYKRDKLSAPDHYGLIAQELEQVLPTLVDNSGINDGDVENIKAVSYTELIPILIKAVQELKAEVDALKGQ
jgi:hypothetical protein